MEFASAMQATVMMTAQSKKTLAITSNVQEIEYADPAIASVWRDS